MRSQKSVALCPTDLAMKPSTVNGSGRYITIARWQSCVCVGGGGGGGYKTYAVIVLCSFSNRVRVACTRMLKLPELSFSRQYTVSPYTVYDFELPVMDTCTDYLVNE